MNDTFCHAVLRSDEHYCPFDQSGVAVVGATNAVRKAVTVSLFFRPSTLTPLTPPPLSTGIYDLAEQQGTVNSVMF